MKKNLRGWVSTPSILIAALGMNPSSARAENLDISSSCFTAIARAVSSEDPAQKVLANPELDFYENERVFGLKPEKDLASFESQTGFFLKHDRAGNLTEAKLRVLTDNPNSKIFVVGDFNKWGEGLSPAEMAPYELHPVAGTRYHEGIIPGIKQGQQYRLMVDGKSLFDPSAAVYSTPGLAERGATSASGHLNSVFWDFERPEAYKMQNPSVDLRGKHATIGEVEAGGLVAEFPRADGKGVGPKHLSDTFSFMADPQTGFMKTFKELMPYNALHFLPVNQSVEGADWRFRYQVYGNFAIDSKFGTPDDFARAVDAFHEQKTAVVLDYLGSHFPFNGELKGSGMDVWKKENGQPLFARNMSPWGTYRYDYANPFVKRFLIDGAISIFKKYKIDGLRIDNVAGILDEPGGREFIVALNKEIHQYKPDGFLMLEDFMFNDRTQSILTGGLGGNVRNGSQYFDFIRSNAQAPADWVDTGKLRNAIQAPWGYKEMAQAPYVTNHDESANKGQGATGAYFVSLVDGGGNFHSYGKTRVFNSLAQVITSYSEDTPQLRLLQRGSLNTNPNVDWSRMNDPEVKNFLKFSAAYTRLVDEDPAFAFQNLKPDLLNHMDDQNKISSIVRTDRVTGKKIYIVVNMNYKDYQDYRIGVDFDHKPSVVLNSDSKDFGGSNQLENKTGGTLSISSDGLHGKSHSTSIPYLAPYSITVFE
jgi:1,4-alpha-glucan branching enzyme